MKWNPKIFVFCLLVLFSIKIITAQTLKDKNNFRNSDKRSEKKVEKLKAKLALTETQVSQLTAIQADYATKIKAVKEAASDRGEAKSAIKTLREEKFTAIKGILNGEQVTKFEAMKSEGKGRRGHKGERGRRGGTPEERAERHTKRLTEKLSLSAEQATKVAAINTDFAAKRKAAKDSAKDREEGKAARETLRSEHKTAIKAVLTPEQTATYEAMKSEGKGRRGHKGERGRHRGTGEERAAKHTERLTKDLSLNTEQAAKVAVINTDFATKRKAAKEAAKDREEGKAVREALRSEHKAAIKAVLTPEQLATYEAMKKERKGRKGRRR